MSSSRGCWGDVGVEGGAGGHPWVHLGGDSHGTGALDIRVGVAGVELVTVEMIVNNVTTRFANSFTIKHRVV